MENFLKRNRGYQIGILLLLLGLSLYIMGMSSPFWTEYHFDASDENTGYNVFVPERERNTHSYAGLWKVCTKSWSGMTCQLTAAESGWYITVKVLQCLGLVGYLLAGCYAALVNCRKRVPDHNRWLEVITGTSSILGLISVMLYVAKTQDVLMTKAQLDHYDKGGVLKYHLSWAFYLDLAGCLAAVVATVQIGLYNRPVQSPDSIPVLSPGSDGTEHTHAQGALNIVTDPMAYPPPYYVLFPPMFDDGGGSGAGGDGDAGAAKPADVAEGAVEGATGVSPALSDTAGISAEDVDTEQPPSYEAAISQSNSVVS